MNINNIIASVEDNSCPVRRRIVIVMDDEKTHKQIEALISRVELRNSKRRSRRLSTRTAKELS